MIREALYSLVPMPPKSTRSESPSIGRPPRDGVGATERVEIRVTAEEHKAYKAAAEAKGQSISQWVREVLGRAVKRVKSE